MIHGHFLDGPAAGEILSFRRAPLFVRVTTKGPKVDVLDQLEDEPEEGEEIHVYARSRCSGMIDYRGRDRAKSGPQIDYHYLPVLEGERFRETAAWRTWARELREAVGPDRRQIPIEDLVALVRSREGATA